MDSKLIILFTVKYYSLKGCILLKSTEENVGYTKDTLPLPPIGCAFSQGKSVQIRLDGITRTYDNNTMYRPSQISHLDF